MAPRLIPPLQRVELGRCLIGYTLLALWWLWPLPRSMVTHAGFTAFEHIEPDYHLIVWGLAWGAHALVTQPHRLFHANAFYPTDFSLAFSEHFLGYQPLFAPAYWLTGNPVLATNWVVIASYPLSATAMYLLARRFVGPPSAALAGFFYAFSPYRYLYSIHVHQLGVHYMPLALFFTERWLERGRVRDASLLALVATLQMLSSVYLAFALLLGYGAYLPVALWRWRERCDWRRLAGLGLALSVAAAVMLAASVPYMILLRVGVIESYDTGPLPLGLAFAAVMASRHLREQLMGPVGYGLAALSLLPPWRGGGAARVIGLLVTVVGAGAAFGLTIPVAGYLVASPYRLFVDWVPGFASVRVPSRFVMTAQLGLALLAGLGFEWLTARAAAKVRWAAATAAVTLALYSFHPLPPMRLYHQPTGDEVPAVYRWLAAHGEGRPVLEIAHRSFESEARRMYLSTFHWLPLVGGYTGYPPETVSYLYGIAARGPASLQDLVDAVDVGWIVVHRDEVRIDAWSAPVSARQGLELAGEWGRDRLLRVTLPPRAERRRRLRLDTVETFEGTGLVPITTACPGQLRLVKAPPEPWPSNTEDTLSVEVRNDGPNAWPGRAAVTRHLVRLRVCLAAPDEAECTASVVRLGNDVPPGGSIVTAARVRAPIRPGTYELRLSLEQKGDGSLERCGFTPLRVPVTVAFPTRGM